MTTSPHLVAVVGSLRHGSVNRIVFDAAADLVPAGTSLTEVPIADVPFFDQDLEVDPEPPPVVALKSAVADADGLLFFTPEYNFGLPAVTKNALDWLSRPFGAGPIAGKPVGIVAASPGGRGGLGARERLTQSAGILTDRLFAETLGIGSVTGAIADGRLTDDETRTLLADWLRRFVDHALDPTA